MLDVLAQVRADRVVAVIRASRVADPVELARTLAQAGIRCVEFTFTIPGAADALRAASDDGTAVVGAGTVVDEPTARTALEAGARFLVSPACTPDVAAAGRESGVPVFLGAFTPTEVVAALAAGAAAVKLFPAEPLGPSYLKQLRGPFPDVLFVPSGRDRRTQRRRVSRGGCGGRLRRRRPRAAGARRGGSARRDRPAGAFVRRGGPLSSQLAQEEFDRGERGATDCLDRRRARVRAQDDVVELEERRAVRRLAREAVEPRAAEPAGP